MTRSRTMFSSELISLLRGVLVSWEVLGVTLVLVLYFFLVFYVARLYRKPRAPRAAPKIKPAKAAKAAQEAAKAAEDDVEIED